jgi:hypothetical protein
MADLEDIVQHISVEGVGDVGATFVTMAHEAESAFESIATAAESGSSGLALFGKGAAGIVIALTAMGVALATLAEKTAETGVKLEDLGESFGTNIAGMQGLEAAFAKFGVGPQQVERAVQRMTTSVANSVSEVNRIMRTSGAVQESAAEGVVSANLEVQDAQAKNAEVAQDQALKVREDIISVADAYHTLQFAAADAASTASNDMLSVGSAALSVQASVNALADAMRDTSVAAADLGATSASLGVEEAQQRLQDLQSGTPNKEANKQLQIRRAQQSVYSAELASKNADYKQETAPRDLALKQEQAQQSLAKSIQSLSDSMLKQTKDQTAVSPVEKAQLHYDQALQKQTKDLAESLTAPARAANALAMALTHVKEAAEKQYETMLKDPRLIQGGMRGEGPLAGHLDDISTRNKNQAVQEQAQQRARDEGRKFAPEDFMAELAKLFQNPRSGLTEADKNAMIAQRGGGRQGQGSAEIVKALENLDIKKVTSEGEKNPAFIQQGAELQKLTDIVSKVASLGAEARSDVLKVVADKKDVIPGGTGGAAGFFTNLLHELAAQRRQNVDGNAPPVVKPEDSKPLGDLKEQAIGAAGSLSQFRDHMSVLDGIDWQKLRDGAAPAPASGAPASGAPAPTSGAPAPKVSAPEAPATAAVSDLGEKAKATIAPLSALSEQAQAAAAALKRIIDAAGSEPQSKSQPQSPASAPVSGNADGGAIRGPGSGTSDSILARLSNGEFVMRAAAVRAYGSDVFDRLNNMQFPGFAMGGPVLAGVGRPAASGAQKAGSVLNLSIDGHHFDGLHAPQDVAEKLTSYAISQQSSSAGRKPSWVR